MQVRSSGRIPPCDPGSAKGGQHRIGHHRSEWIRAGKGRGSVCGARAHHPRRLVRLTERLFGCIMGTRSPETAPVRDLRGGSRRAARTHRRSRLGSQHDPQARTHTGRAAVGLNRQGAHQKEHSQQCCPVPPHRPSPDVAPPCGACAAERRPHRPPTARIAAPTAARASSSSMRKVARPTAPSAGSNAASADRSAATRPPIDTCRQSARLALAKSG